MGYLIRGRIRAEGDNPLNRGLILGYRPLLEAVLHHPKATLVLAGVLLLTALVPMAKLGSEFMPAMDEGTLLYMRSEEHTSELQSLMRISYAVFCLKKKKRKNKENKSDDQ